MTAKAKKLARDLRLTQRCITEKWYPIALGRSTKKTDEWRNCPLCLEYNSAGWETTCRTGCPICEETGYLSCEGTPLVHHSTMFMSQKRAMLMYLIGLCHRLADQLDRELG